MTLTKSTLLPCHYRVEVRDYTPGEGIPTPDGFFYPEKPHFIARDIEGSEDEEFDIEIWIGNRWQAVNGFDFE